MWKEIDQVVLVYTENLSYPHAKAPSYHHKGFNKHDKGAS